jgi:ABC-type bacteriocin/lantibiotic exporter with double-glycine peptidase domain
MSIFLLLNKKFGKEILFCFCTLIFSAILEFLSFASFFPALIILFKKDSLSDFNFLNSVYVYLNFSNYYEFLIFSLIFLCFIFLIKNFFLGFSYWLNIKLTSDIQIYLSNILLNNYLNKSYIFFTNNNSSKIIRDVISEISIFTRSYLLSILNLTLELLIFITLIFIIFIINPKITVLVISYFIIVSVLLYLIFKSYIKKWGTERLPAERLRLQFLQEGIGGIKEVKIFSLENFFVNKFSHYNKISVNTIAYAGYITQIPRLVFEFLLVFTLLIIFLINFYLQKPFEDALYIIGALAVASLRIFPGINKIFISINTINYSKPSVKLIKNELLKVEKKNKDIHNSFHNFIFKKNTKIKFQNVNFNYNDTENQSINNINLTINHGSLMAFIGKTGSGKTTILNLLTGLLDPKSGEITVDDINISNNLFHWRKFISYVPQTPFFIDDTILTNIAIGVDPANIDYLKINNLLELTDLKDFISQLPQGLMTSVGESAVKISGGQKQRIAICRALYRDTKIIVLDEATSALDTLTEKKVLKNLMSLKNDKTIIIVSHKIQDLDFDSIYEIKNGHILKNK